MASKEMADVFYDELRDILSAEKQLTQALPKLAKSANNPDLKAAFESHLEETKTHVERLEKACEILGKSARAKHCEAMEGLVKEGAELMEEEVSPELLDAMLIAAAQKVEHYEIASYGTVVTWAKELGHNDIARLLKETIAEEKAADEKLNLLATTINKAALV